MNGDVLPRIAEQEWARTHQWSRRVLSALQCAMVSKLRQEPQSALRLDMQRFNQLVAAATAALDAKDVAATYATTTRFADYLQSALGLVVEPAASSVWSPN